MERVYITKAFFTEPLHLPCTTLHTSGYYNWELNKKVAPMKQIIKPAVLAISVTCALALPQMSVAKENANRNGPFAQIELTDEQRLALKELGGFKHHRKHRSNPLRAFAPVVFADEIDQIQLETLVDAGIAKRKAVGLRAAQKRFDVKQILTEEQIAEIKEARENKPQREGKPHDLQTMLTVRLALSDEQIAQIQPALENIAQLRITAKNEKAAFKTFERSLMEQDVFDTQAWVTQFDLVSASMRSNSLSLATNMHDIYLLLDEERQKKLERLANKGKRKGKGKDKKERKARRDNADASA